MRRATLLLFSFLALLVLAPPPASSLPDAPAAEADSTMADTAYCTAQDVIDAYSLEQMAEVTGDAGGETVNEAQVERAVRDYGAHVTAHVRMQYPSDPFGASHEYLNSLNVEGAFLLMQKRTTGGMEENLQDAEERLDDILLKIAEGQLDLHALSDDEATGEDETELNPDELIRAAPRRFGSHRWPERQRLS